MPLIYINYPAGTFSKEKQNGLADKLTTIALDAEQLPDTPFVRSTTWIYFREYAEGMVYHGGKTEGRNVISIEVNAFKGGFDTAAKQKLFAGFTEAIREAAGLGTDDLVPVYIVLRDVPPENWGVFGQTISLNDLRHPPENAEPV